MRLKRMVIDVRERSCVQQPSPSLPDGEIGEVIVDLAKDIERYQDEAWTAGASFASAAAKVCRIASDISRG